MGEFVTVKIKYPQDADKVEQSREMLPIVDKLVNWLAKQEYERLKDRFING